MALHHNASNMHLSLTRCTSLSCAETLTERPLGFIDPATTHVRCVPAVNTVRKPLGLTWWCSPPSINRRTMVKGCKKCEMWRCTGRLVCTLSAVELRGALWRWPRYNERRGQSHPQATLAPAPLCIHVRVTLHLSGIFSKLCPQFTSWIQCQLQAGPRTHTNGSTCPKAHRWH